MSQTAVLSAQLDRFDALIDAPDPRPRRRRSLDRTLLRRVGGVLLLAVAVTQAWVVHSSHLIRRRLTRHRSDAGMTTAEYAVGTVAACGFAALLYKVVTSGAVSSALNALVNRALHAV